jgi:hypothetical protein
MVSRPALVNERRKNRVEIRLIQDMVPDTSSRRRRTGRFNAEDQKRRMSLAD